MNPAENLGVAVIIVLYNSLRWIQKCLSTVFSSDMPVSIYLVDNASTDGTVQWITEHYSDRVSLHCSPTNLGFGKANNIALKQAYLDGHEYFFLLNQDCYVYRTSIQLLYQSIKANPGFGVVSPFHLNSTGSQPDKQFETFINPTATPKLLDDWVGGNISESLYPSKFINAAAWMLSRNCLETVGLFNPAFYHYGEDVNYIHRVLYHQLNVGVYAKSMICHDKLYGDTANSPKQKRYNLKVYFLMELSHPQRYAGYLKLVAEHFVKMVMAFFRRNLPRRKSLSEKLLVLFSINPFVVNTFRNQSLEKGKTYFGHTEPFIKALLKPRP